MNQGKAIFEYKREQRRRQQQQIPTITEEKIITQRVGRSRERYPFIWQSMVHFITRLNELHTK